MISIIIPVYNAEKYLDDCLQSFYNQSYSDWECILVNDGSTDNSLQICNSWAKKDNRFHLINQKNKGVSYARNVGISRAIGDYIYFLDSDDFCHSSLFSFISNNVEMIIGEYESLYQESTLHHKHYNYDKTNYALSYLKEQIRCCMGSFIVKRDILLQNDIYFSNKYKYGEDMEFILKILLSTSNISIVDKKFVTYRTTNNSAMSKYSFDRFSVFFSRLELIKYAKTKGNSDVAFYLQKFSCPVSIIDITKNLLLHKFSISQIVTFFNQNNIIIFYLEEAQNSILLNKHYKIFAWMLLNYPYLFYIFVHMNVLYYNSRSFIGKIKRKLQ